tara:strand:+ start:1034 stop:1297 length:264 start_codon:yes stop_codon:yes gene_type:complete
MTITKHYYRDGVEIAYNTWIDMNTIQRGALEAFTSSIAYAPQEVRIHAVEQMILHLMDYTSQEDDMNLWLDLYDQFRALQGKYKGQE